VTRSFPPTEDGSSPLQRTHLSASLAPSQITLHTAIPNSSGCCRKRCSAKAQPMWQISGERQSQRTSIFNFAACCPLDILLGHHFDCHSFVYLFDHTLETHRIVVYFRLWYRVYRVIKMILAHPGYWRRYLRAHAVVRHAFHAIWYIDGASMESCQHLQANAITTRQIVSEKTSTSGNYEHPLSLSS
jgi:hypothetical protein